MQSSFVRKFSTFQHASRPGCHGSVSRTQARGRGELVGAGKGLNGREEEAFSRS